VVRSSPAVTIAPGDAATMTANCPAGEVATGGGIKFESLHKYDITGASYPRTASGPAGEGETPIGWGGRAYNGSEAPKDAVAYAVCVQR
jgi:hypothetical protein